MAKSPMIVVEGMDNTGKSTLVDFLAHELKACVVKTFKKAPSVADVFEYNGWCSRSHYPLILDRVHYISDLVYGTVIRDHTSVTQAMASFFRRDTILIYCRPPEEVIFSFGEREQMNGVKEQAVKLLAAYDELMARLSPDITYDYTVDNQEGVLQHVLSAIRRYL